MSEDSKLVQLRLVGDGDARQRFERFVRPHYDTLFRVAFRFTGAVADAEDLVQETCVRAYRRVDEVAGLDNPLSWLICVMRRLYIDETRRYERRHASSFEAMGEGGFRSEAAGPAESAESEMLAQRIGDGWRKLGKEHRTLLALHDVEGYSLAELETMTGLKTGTIKSRLHRARVKLGRLLRAQGGVEEAGTDRRKRS